MASSKLKKFKINKSAIQEKLEKLNNRNAGNEHIWKPEIGRKHTVRLVPNPHSDDPGSEPFVELWFHYGLGKPILSPRKNFGKDSCVDDFASRLWNDGTDKEKALAKQLFPKPRWFGLVIDREEKDPKPKWWSFSKTVYEELMNYLQDPDYENFMDIEDGLDLSIDYYKEEGAQFPNTRIKFKRKESPVMDDVDEAIELIESAPKLIPDVVEKMTEDEIAEAVKKYLDKATSSSKDEDDDSDEEEKPARKKKAKTTKVDSSDEDDIDEIFDKAKEKVKDDDDEDDDALAKAMQELEDDED